MALGNSTASDVSGAVSDLFAAQGYEYKAEGAAYEQKNYLLAAQLADQNDVFTQWSTAIKQTQADREITKSLGETRADVAGAGLAESGSALDILRESASQGALQKQVLGEQGLITEAGYQEQADSYRNMARAAQVAIDAANTAEMGSYVSAAVKGVAAIATLA